MSNLYLDKDKVRLAFYLLLYLATCPVVYGQIIESDTSWLEYRNEFKSNNIARIDTCYQKLSVAPITFYDNIDDSDYARKVEKFGKNHYLWYAGNDSLQDLMVVLHGLVPCYDKAARIVNKSMYHYGIVLWDTTYTRDGSVIHSSSFDTLTGFYEKIKYLPNGRIQVSETYIKDSLTNTANYPEYQIHPSIQSLDVEIDLNERTSYADTLYVELRPDITLNYRTSDNITMGEIARYHSVTDSNLTIFYETKVTHDLQRVYNRHDAMLIINEL